MATPENLLTRYVTYNGSAGKEYATYRAVKEETAYSADIYFTLGGKGVPSQTTARTLGELLDNAKEEVNVKEGRRSNKEIQEGTEMTKNHHERLVSQLEDEVEEYGKETTAEEWLIEVKG